jgi:hypothetical protein
MLIPSQQVAIVASIKHQQGEDDEIGLIGERECREDRTKAERPNLEQGDQC